MLRKSQLGRQTLSRRLNKLLKWKTIVECKDTYMVQNGKLIYKATEHKCNASTKLPEEVLILISTLTIGVKILCTWCQNMQQWNLSWETPQGVSRTRDQIVVCHKCEQRFTNFAKMRHNDVCHEKQEFDCPACGMVLNTADAVQSHYNREHKMEAVLSREMCYHWKRGTCIVEWMIVAVLVKYIPEEGSGRWQDEPVCHRGLSIFQD